MIAVVFTGQVQRTMIGETQGGCKRMHKLTGSSHYCSSDPKSRTCPLETSRSRASLKRSFQRESKAVHEHGREMETVMS